MSDLWLLLNYVSQFLALVVLWSVVLAWGYLSITMTWCNYIKDVLFPILLFGFIPLIEIVLFWNYSIHAPLTLPGLVLMFANDVVSRKRTSGESNTLTHGEA